MLISVFKTVRTVEELEIEFPYYYKHDLRSDDGESVIYGKIEEGKHSSIHEVYSFGGNFTSNFEIEIEDISKNYSSLSNYFEEEFKSTKQEFESVKQRALNHLNSI